MGAFATIVEAMAGMDVFQLFFPWLLVLAVSYGVLNKSDFLGGDQTVNGVAALALSFMTIGGAYFFVPDGLFVNFGAALGFGVLAIIGLVVLLGVAGFDLGQLAEDKSSLPIIMAIIIFILSFLGVLAFQMPWGSLLGGTGSSNTFEEVVMPILTLVFLLLVVVFVSSE